MKKNGGADVPDYVHLRPRVLRAIGKKQLAKISVVTTILASCGLLRRWSSSVLHPRQPRFMGEVAGYSLTLFTRSPSMSKIKEEWEPITLLLKALSRASTGVYCPKHNRNTRILPKIEGLKGQNGKNMNEALFSETPHPAVTNLVTTQPNGG